MYKSSTGCKMSSPWSKRGDIAAAANEQDNHFFKVMIGDFRDRMIIPDKFVQKFRRQITRTVKLESRNGNTFDVHVTEDLHKLVLQSGWEEFVSAHGISMGDFLVFNYDGNSWFKVLIFEPSGCERLSSSFLPMETAPYEGQEWGEKLTGTLSMRHDLPMIRSPQSERGTMIVQWDNSNHGENIMVLGSSSAPSSESSGCISSSEDDLQAHPARRLILLRGTCPTGSQKKKLKVKIRDIYSEIPIVGCTIRKSSIHGKPYTLEICREYAEVYLPFEDETIVLRRHGKIWKVRCCISQYGSKRLLKGWRQFVCGNNLRLGDICLFKLLKNKKYTMDVYIIRKE
ncbi:putative B3 domain-containing protein Os03g0621600 [Triticum dicoccoides]|uniref:putative B3 domain-containing protein Os03g0621600 n=1 Tax=Triticum dicoccoides TaxID=85692 RepID=UPI000E7BC6D6|nr:putative B3 domain-containing protein Os03g0621600 [Triticum dicoccoides]XP_037427753.1 putative B3 domain-containing protein Os03g0621600 [Triticum dicoccoides]